METFSIKEALLWGWQKFKDQPWFFVNLLLLIFVINVLVTFVADKEVVGTSVLASVGQLIGIVLQWWITIGLVGILIAVYDGKTVSIGQLFSQSAKTLWNYALGTVLYFLIVIGGLILLIVPGIIWAVKFHYYIYFIVDKNMEPVEALKQSAVITKERKWTILGFFIVIGLVNIAGVLALGVGLFVSMPVTFLASVWVYKWLDKRNSGSSSVASESASETLQST